ncbi:class I SAM-dependent methyltransferase [Synechocystis sp. CACIAM 05]|uniref:class I SAM-dependent methyltransferase n=1 Tax=Synechocystis sp. CACIAM 05 TaxID=1933929 RepID=UPI00138E7E1D|nr:class I SAM-dependent methyltransferase [Synechocystis sp. CACIAM 05]QHU99000.1 hypothetical protein BWK47_01855 [Synechocystis sp. CACIAM 05]
MSLYQAPEYEFYRQKIDDVSLSKEELVLQGGKRFALGQRYNLIEEYCKRNGKQFKNLVEIGCHTGQTILYMSEHNFAENLIGIDIAISQNLQNLESNKATFIESNANNNFPLANQSVDAVVAMMVMEHVFDPFHFCNEVSRILEKNGILFLNVPLITALKHRLSLLSGQMPVTSTPKWFEMREWDGGHLHYFTIPLLKKLLGLYSLKIIDIRGVGSFAKIKSLFPEFLAAEISLICQKY